MHIYTPSVTEKAEDAHEQLETMKSQVIPSPELLREGGYDIELPEELQSLSYFKAFPDAEWIEKFLRFGQLIPMEAAIEFSVAGTPEDCVTKIDEYIKAGAKHFLLINIGPDPRRVVELYSREIIPRFR